MIPNVPKLRPNTDAERHKYLLSSKTESRIFVPIPSSLEYIPFQIAGVEYMDTGRNTLNADPMGLGKTIQTVGFMNFKCILRAVVLCPTSLVYKWKREIEKWHVGSIANTGKDGINTQVWHPSQPTDGIDVLILGYHWAADLDAVKQLLKRTFRYQILIIDEAHFLKNPAAKRTKHVLAENGLKSKADYVHALSGTPIVNRPMELYPIIKSLAPDAIGGMNQFEYGIHFCAGHKRQINKDGKEAWFFEGASNLKLLGVKLRGNFMLRRVKEDVLPQLPEIFPPNVVYLNEGGNVTRFDRFDENLVIKKAPTVNFTEVSTLRRELGEAKIVPAAEYIRTQLESGHDKIVVFAHHTSVVKGLEEKLHDFGVVKIIGETNAQEREQAVQAFQNKKEVRVFLGSITAAGQGIDLVAASYVIIVEPSWVPGENEQAIDRVHRIGQTRGVQVDYLVFENTLDERVLKYLIVKTKNIKEVYRV